MHFRSLQFEKVALLSALAVLFMAFTFGNGSGGAAIEKKEKDEKHTHNVSFEVEGIDNEERADRLAELLKEAEGIKQSNACEKNEEARAEYNPDKMDTEEIQEMIEDLGLETSEIEEGEAKSCSPGCTKECCT